MEEKRYLKRKEKALIDGNRDQLAIACNILGDFYNQEGKYQKAVEEYQEEAELYGKLNKNLEMAKAHRMVGEMCMLLSDFDKAKEHINIYLKNVKQLKSKVEEQRAYATLGRAHLLHGQSLAESAASSAMQQLKQAEKAFLRSLLLIKDLTGLVNKLEQLDMQARCYLNMGVVKEHMEDFEEALNYIEKAIKISKTHDLFELTHLCYVSMSFLYHSKKDDATSALRCVNLAYDFAKRLPDKVKKLCETLITKSEILIAEGDFASAKQILTKAYKKNTPNINDRNQIEKTLRVVVKICQILDELVTTSLVDYAIRKSLYEKLGDGCCHLSNYEKAIEYYLKMLECAEKNGETGKALVPIYVSLYQTYKDNKQYDKALEYLWKEYDLNKDVPAEAFSSLCGIAEVCELQMQPFWTIQDLYVKAREQAALSKELQPKLEKIVFGRMKKLQLKHNMDVLLEELEEEAKQKGIDLTCTDEDSDSDSETSGNDQNTPDLGEDVCLDDLTDSDTSDLDETDKPRPHRVTRGVRALTIKRNNKGETQLHQACISGNLELVKRLLDQGHVVNVRDHAGWLPLHEAANHGYTQIVALLLDRGATVAINDKGGTSCDGITPLYDACSNGFLDVVELLLEKGADTTVKTDFGDNCVDALDKWRAATTLTESEQAQYVQVRKSLVEPLTMLGICTMKNLTPLTNAKIEFKDTLTSEDREMNSSDDDHDIARSSGIRTQESLKILKDRNKKSPRSPNASSEYKNVMAQLKRPNRQPIIDDDPPCPYKQKRTALLDNDEVDDDDWLIDDVGPEKKKRRYGPIINEPRSFSATSSGSLTNQDRHSLSKENLHDSANATWDSLDCITPENDAFQTLLENASGSQQRKKQAKKLSLSRSSSISSSNSLSSINHNIKPKYQSSLLDSGFCRFRSESPISSEDSNEANGHPNLRVPSTEPDSTTTSIHLLISPSKSSPVKIHASTTPLVPSTVSFKIKVENELLLVPIERKKLNEINIRWLADEAARRYYNLIGLKPILRLKTSDGFAYEENDPVNVAVEQNMILATVLEWKLSPLSLRYEEMCQQSNKEINLDIKKVLERAQLSNVIQMKDFWLTFLQTEPIFKALLHQTQLSVLDLQNNFIQNEGCRQLARSIPTLKQLKTLNLSGNFITSEGLNILLNCPGFDKLELLEELNFSQNPLGNSSMRILHRFSQGANGKSLQKLYLSHCNITNLFDYDLCYHQLSEFDISFNQLNQESMRNLLTKLNSCRLMHLNLSYTQSPQQMEDERSRLSYAERLIGLFESGTCEKFKTISLCGCDLSDANMYKLMQCLSRAPDLELLDITDNEKLTGASLQLLLDEVPQLRKLKAIGCSSFVDMQRLENLDSIKALPNMMCLTLNDKIDEEMMLNIWKRHWNDKAKFKSDEEYLTLYINDKDLNNY